MRELENTIERAVVLTTGSTITRDVVTVGLTEGVRAADVPSLNLRQNVEWIERETIRRALDMSTLKGDAARLMGISARALVLLSGQIPPHRPEPSTAMRFAKMEWSCATRSWLLLIPSLPVFLMAAVAAHGPAAGMVSTTSTPIGCASAVWHDLHVHLVNEAGAAPRTLDGAMAEASTIWASAGLRLRWSLPPAPFDVMNGRTVVVVVRRSQLSRRDVDAADTHASHPPLGRLMFREDGRPGHLIEVSLEALTSLIMDGSLLDRPIAALPTTPGCLFSDVVSAESWPTKSVIG